jgi:general secretion pathway protein G
MNGTQGTADGGKRPLSRQARARAIKQIYREMEAKKRELGLRAPVLKRGVFFYAVVLFVLLMIGGAVIQAAGKGGGRTLRDGRLAQAERSVAALAEALGRFKFHCGTYPAPAEGLEALALKRSRYAGWVGPYCSKILPDPWKRPYVYDPSSEPPVLLSLGPDGQRGTADDIRPDAALFTKPFRDTTWTNDWVPYQLRGYIVVPSRADKGKVPVR